MPDLKKSLNSTLIAGVMEFLGKSGSLKECKALSVWRSLSLTNQAIGDGELQAQKTANFASCVNLTDAAAQHLAQCPQLQTVDFVGCRPELDGRGRRAPRAVPAAPDRELWRLPELDGRGRPAPRAVPAAPDREL